MIIVLMIILIGITIYCEYKCKQNDWSYWDIGKWFTIPLLCICFIAFLLIILGLVGQRIIDQEIELYSTQNKEIESKIEVSVKQYMKYESDTFKELKPDSYINLVNLYPELKSDKLIQQQIDIYQKNNQTILELKQEKINKTIYKWWLYFGK